jgi:hypothetical protein
LGHFFQVDALSDGNLVVAGYYHVGSTSYARVHKLSSADGATVWTWTASAVDDSEIRVVEELPDGRIAAAGGITPSPGLFRYVVLATLSADGQELSKWFYDLDEDAEATSLEPAPDGGFFIGGTIILSKSSSPFVGRIGPSGSLLWHRVYDGTSGSVNALELTGDAGLLAFVAPEDAPPRLACLDQADGDVLWEVDYSGVMPAGDGSMCAMPEIEGYALCSEGWGAVVGQAGGIVWSAALPGYYTRTLCSVARTMDGGLVFAGADHYFWNPEPPYEQHSYNGWLVRTDGEGATLWMLDVDDGHETVYSSVKQLAGGGYGLCGMVSGTGGNETAYALVYDPELGLDEEAFTITALRAYPNPSGAGLWISWSQALAGTLELSLFDVSGRLVDQIACSPFQPGPNGVFWSRGEEVAAGLYILSASTGSGRTSAMVVLL